MKKIISLYAHQINLMTKKIQNLPLESKIKTLKHYNVPVIVLDFCGGIKRHLGFLELKMTYYFVHEDIEEKKFDFAHTVENLFENDIVFVLMDWKLNGDMENVIGNRTKENVFIVSN